MRTSAPRSLYSPSRLISSADYTLRLAWPCVVLATVAWGVKHIYGNLALLLQAFDDVSRSYLLPNIWIPFCRAAWLLPGSTSRCTSRTDETGTRMRLPQKSGLMLRVRHRPGV